LLVFGECYSVKPTRIAFMILLPDATLDRIGKGKPLAYARGSDQSRDLSLDR
jgi:hypothetical protein